MKYAYKMSADYPVDSVPSIREQREKRVLMISAILMGALMNLGVGTIVLYLKLPFYLDSMGTILAAILLGIRTGIGVGILSTFVTGILIYPLAPYYIVTQVVLAICAGLMARGAFFKSVPKTIVTGLLLGIIAAAVSAPVTIKLFSGVAGWGVSIITATLLANGQSIVKSVLFSHLPTDPADKVAQCLIVMWLINSFSYHLRSRFANIGYLQRNLGS